ncbi:hypothetical protein [Yersinia pseudotuberculosis]|uniref:hypothetical protein n=1 Tax=Yersinia pseudotuberculosis TaxID=633 RepID=UPI00061CC2FE|nr:hypothetical protein [Yersinia pseudotuberculosis]AXY33098.1 hypothetical protein CEQ20_06505 [Yersinia pseudotuberculosis]AYX12656.1 hypothetical protein EGX52_18820 [Yersinia pseudotuberculosis]MBO1567831.1 hypothetical protein [Yersinia pseudotuberculosis]MBO1591465.1 hypothetical protein [Yersinia pseudotuberculosis]MBO1604690.1 hypothetical protein [Yersinia pseudotuberculosis]
MNGRSFLKCNISNKSPTWGMLDIFMWKVIPNKFGGGKNYIQRFKDAWVIHNKTSIRIAAETYRLPVELLAGVCWIEVGGDPNFIDRVAFEVRSFDWSGPDYVDKNLTITSPPEKTSFGFVSIQLRTAAKTIGLDPIKMNSSQLRALANCIEKDIYNIDLVAKHLRQLANYDNLPSKLRMDDIKIIGARYNRGIIPTLEEIKRNTSYGNFIVNHWQRFNKLIWG